MSEAAAPMRIWWQSFVDPSQNAPYLERLEAYLSEIADPGTSVRCTASARPTAASGG